MVQSLYPWRSVVVILAENIMSFNISLLSFWIQPVPTVCKTSLQWCMSNLALGVILKGGTMATIRWSICVLSSPWLKGLIHVPAKFYTFSELCLTKWEIPELSGGEMFSGYSHSGLTHHWLCCYWFTAYPMPSVGQTQQTLGFEHCQSW